MRNLLEYPITNDEKIAALDRAIKRIIADGCIGGIDAAALADVREHLMSNAEFVAGLKAKSED